MTSDETRPPYDAELPILAELEGAWRAAAIRAIEAPADAASAATAARGPRRLAPATASALPAPERSAAAQRPRREHDVLRTRRGASAHRFDAGRVARRVGVLTGLTCLLAASAVAMRSLVSDDAPDPTQRTSATVRLASGTVDGSRWFLDAYRRGSETCYDLIAAGRLATACEEAPGPRDLHVDGTLGPMTRVVIGLSGSEIRSVRVSEGSEQRVVPTTAVPTRGTARAARLPRGLRFFVATLPRTDAPVGSTSARVVRYDRSGERVGAAIVKP
jgi:hypothetical protein